ncbi:ankyrin repeat-containing protein [Histomonas meleagridis]|uniref:ankyrin repeat-containing protein n=1 Tax=Histomonas meleagridis TaxID=135588 RepID=UPI00355A1880|nr:ankyrin repeat-containing protein [Histomonas meleagridis]KAH0804425.1 ankyrin repeat-containing protein [Histomonas meleagridis]
MQSIINYNNSSTVRLLLDYGEDPSVILPNGDCALKLACFHSRVSDVEALCEKLDEVDIPVEMRYPSAVHWICSSKSSQIAEIVLKKGIDVNRLDGYGRQGPFYLLDTGDEAEALLILDLLLDNGYEIDLKSSGEVQTTMLGEFVCAIQKEMRVIEWFLLHGANIHEDVYGKEIVDVVKEMGDNEMIEMFGRYHPDEFCE